MRQNTLFIIDDDRARAGQLNTLLNFMEAGEVVMADNSNWTRCLEDLRGLQAVFLGRSPSDIQFDDRISAIQKASNVPIILLEDDRERRQPLPRQLEEICFARLVPPFGHSTLEAILNDLGRRRTARRAPGQRNVELFRSLVGNSAGITQVRELIARVAHSEATVLILGESGTGKEVVARNLHYHSPRRKGPFVPINCGAIPENLLESELFGHEKGAFTGALSARKGRFELAEGGTLFLDEIGDMPLQMQVKLLRVLQERTFERVGSNTSLRADVRIIAATHRDLDAMVAEETFREDLYYRLNVFPIELPSLRERIDDLPLLVDELISRIEGEQGVDLRLSPHTLLCLQHYPWPGNVRELANLMERLSILKPNGLVELEDLPEKFKTGFIPPAQPEVTLPGLDQDLNLPAGGIDLKRHMADLETHIIKLALEQSQGVVARAATTLKMSRTTLMEKIRKYGLEGYGG
ncbi:MAG: sigma-54 dependent transcriptional regulator [Candidatus Competibacteraceae bacterium]|nr:sigma-54 dependent transcriptional regulator [Candidatus Competibacteraceae bacterium]